LIFPADSKLGTAMLLTPRSADSSGSAIAVVRLRGPGVAGFLAKYFSGKARGGRAVHGELREAGQIIDDPLVVLSHDGLWADLNLHGGASIIRATLEMAEREGFKIIDDPGPPIPHDVLECQNGGAASFQKCQNGGAASFQGSKTSCVPVSRSELVISHEALDEISSILEREVVAHLPLARTELGIRALRFLRIKPFGVCSIRRRWHWSGSPTWANRRWPISSSAGSVRSRRMSPGRRATGLGRSRISTAWR
jgi:hypothetical protein